MKALTFKLKLLLIIILLGLVQISHAQNKEEVSLEQATETIRKESKGQVVSATTNRYNGVKSHRIQVLTETGRVKVYQVPANKSDIPQHNSQSNSQRVDNPADNYRNIKPNNTTFNQNQQRKPSTQNRSNNNRTHNSRNSYNRSPNSSTRNTTTYSNGGAKKQ